MRRTRQLSPRSPPKFAIPLSILFLFRAVSGQFSRNKSRALNRFRDRTEECEDVKFMRRPFADKAQIDTVSADTVNVRETQDERELLRAYSSKNCASANESSLCIRLTMPTQYPAINRLRRLQSGLLIDGISGYLQADPR